jgi:Universal stress protein family
MRLPPIARADLQVLSESEALSAGGLCDTVHASDARPYKAILDTASTKGCDLIAMGSHRQRGIAGTQKTLTHGKIPVLVYRPFAVRRRQQGSHRLKRSDENVASTANVGLGLPRFWRRASKRC